MSRVFEDIDDNLRRFVESQRMFFVATAPLSPSGHANLSPKGLDTLRILGRRTIAYLDYVGSGAETIAHTRENGRIVLMLCAFEGPPRIVRLHGRADVLEPDHGEYRALRTLFPAQPQARAVIRVMLDRISDSCGFGVPRYTYVGDRSQLADWSDRKGRQGLRDYRVRHNGTSIDGLPALCRPDAAED